MKKTIIFITFIMLIGIVYSLDECTDETDSGATCIVTTPKLDCSTYDIYNTTNQLSNDDASMVQIGTTGIYYFNFSKTTTGKYTVILCSNDTTTINVKTLSDSTKIQNILSNVTSITSGTFNASGIWNYNITTYNVSGDYHSAGAYLRALEVYRYG